MPKDSPGGEPLQFPVHCHFKIIADDRDGIQDAIQKALIQVGVLTPISRGNRSEKGTYITFNLELLVNSKEHMTEIDSCIRAVTGVKMVM